jgi:hypothetical protein
MSWAASWEATGGLPELRNVRAPVVSLDDEVVPQAHGYSWLEFHRALWEAKFDVVERHLDARRRSAGRA